MHPYYRDPVRLRGWLGEFVGGQFCMAMVDGEILRGEVESIEIPIKGVSKKTIYVKLKWTCRKGAAVDKNNIPGEKWIEEVRSRVDNYIINLEYSWYYFQKSKRRVKIKTTFGERCWFFMKDDPTNLNIDMVGEFIPKNKTSEVEKLFP